MKIDEITKPKLRNPVADANRRVNPPRVEPDKKKKDKKGYVKHKKNYAQSY